MLILLSSKQNQYRHEQKRLLRQTLLPKILHRSSQVDLQKLGTFPFEIESIENLPVKVTEYVNKEMDLLFLVTKPCGEQVILHIEAQTHNDKKMPNRMFLYLALLKNLHPDKKIYQIYQICQSNCTMQNKLGLLMLACS